MPDNTEEQLLKSLKVLLLNEDLAHYKTLIKRLSAELNVSYLDCAAAIFSLKQLDLVSQSQSQNNQLTQKDFLSFLPKPKLVKYRLGVGYKHQLTQEEVHNTLVEVAGVDRKLIGKLDIRNYYTLIELPDGMPADVFQLLSETEMHSQKLDIKRIKYAHKFKRRHFKKRSAKV